MGVTEADVQQPTTVKLHPKFLEPRDNFTRAKRFFHIRGKRAMFLALEVRFSNKTTRVVEFLVDTGAEINLIRPDMVPKECIGAPTRIVRMATASNDVLRGGDSAIQTDVVLYGEEIGREFPKGTERRFPVELYLGEIRVEGILSYD